MKYFTKGWYELCQKTSAHLLLKEDVQAESFSEEYFQTLYQQKLGEFLDLRLEVSQISHEPFDIEKLTKQFEKGFMYNLQHYKKMLPEEILKNIADIRVYVLNMASHQVINDVTRFCEENKNSVDKAIEEYNKYYSEALKEFDKNIVENIRFHDCIVTDIKQTEQSVSVLFDNSGGFPDIYEMRFENYKIIKQDSSLENSWWLYDEIYKKDGNYELHVLLQNKNNDLVDFIISAENIVFNR